MLCFMMWMSGSTLHLFSIMTTLSGIYQPLSGGCAGATAAQLGALLSLTCKHPLTGARLLEAPLLAAG